MQAGSGSYYKEYDETPDYRSFSHPFDLNRIRSTLTQHYQARVELYCRTYRSPTILIKLKIEPSSKADLCVTRSNDGRTTVRVSLSLNVGSVVDRLIFRRGCLLQTHDPSVDTHQDTLSGLFTPRDSPPISHRQPQTLDHPILNPSRPYGPSVSHLPGRRTAPAGCSDAQLVPTDQTPVVRVR